MSLEVIGPGFGRTGTLSLKQALEILDFGPCHHMEEVFRNPAQVPHWQAVAARKPVVWGWEPLCRFLGKPVPDVTFPRSNSKEEFWKLIRGEPH